MSKIVNVDNTPIIFPKYTALLMEKGVDVEIVGSRETDSKLTSVVYEAILSNSVNELPDIMKYDIKSKTWESIYVETGEKVSLQNKTSILVTYVNFVSDWTNQILTVIKNFVAQFSAATVLD